MMKDPFLASIFVSDMAMKMNELLGTVDHMDLVR